MLATYWPVLSHDFVEWDDDKHITINPHFTPLSKSGLKFLLTEPYFGEYVPLTYLVFAAEYYISPLPEVEGARREPDPRIFHAGTLLLHIVSVLLVYAVLNFLVDNGPAALLGALLFGLHPLQVESVAWISETRGVLAAVWGWVAILCYLRYAGARRGTVWLALRGETPTTGKISPWFAIAATMAYGLALLSKPSAVSIPLIVAVLDFGLLRRHLSRIAPLLTLWLMVAGGMIWFMRSTQEEHVQDVGYEVATAPLVAGDALAFYLQKLIVPIQLAADHGRTPDYVRQQWWFWLTPLIPCVVLLLLSLPKSRRIWLTVAGVFVAGVLPVLGLVPFGYQLRSTVADRYAYLPMFGVAMGVAILLTQYRSVWLRWASVAVLILFGILANLQSKVWESTESLFTQALAVNPRSYVASASLGILHYRDQELPEAEELLRLSLKNKSDYWLPHMYLGQVLMLQRKFEEAGDHFRSAVESNPERASVRLNYGTFLLTQKQYEAAVPEFLETIKLDDQKLAAYVKLAEAYIFLDRFQDARATLSDALELHPNWAESHYWMSVADFKQGRYSQAARNTQKALDLGFKLDPAYEQLARAYFKSGQPRQAMNTYTQWSQDKPTSPLPRLSLAWAWATHLDSEIRDGKKALILSSQLCEKTNYQNVRLLDILAAAHAELGEFDEAVRFAGMGATVAQRNGDRERARELVSRQARYRLKKPYRDLNLAPDGAQLEDESD
jgi:tetratricopeptide (TPR) repeat protein